MLWSDPQPQNGRGFSKRGVGIQFGPDITEQFCASNKLDYIIRSHEVKAIGIIRSLLTFKFTVVPPDRNWTVTKKCSKLGCHVVWKMYTSIIGLWLLGGFNVYKYECLRMNVKLLFGTNTFERFIAAYWKLLYQFFGNYLSNVEPKKIDFINNF